jgi:hypothetical protein
MITWCAALNEFRNLYESEDPEFMEMIQQVTILVDEYQEIEAKKAA